MPKPEEQSPLPAGSVPAFRPGAEAVSAALTPSGRDGAICCRREPMDVLGQTTRLASSSALLQVRARPGPPPSSSPFSSSSTGPGGSRLGPARPAGVSRAASPTGAVPGGHVRAERLHPALPVQGAARRGQRQVGRRLQAPGPGAPGGFCSRCLV